ncbi:MAG: alpha/beta hydrolase [Alkalimonas sp.]|nr:alpha/beta hydrolase [Alkalimonas sp.]
MNNNLPMPSPQINRPAQPVARLLLAHGAGAGACSDFMQWLAEALVQVGVEVWRFNFPYMQQQLAEQKKRPPNRMPVLQQYFQQQIASCPADLPLFIGGKSMGGRVASMLTAEQKVQGALAYGYPFHAPGKKVYRTTHFAELAQPLLILQGSRDSFGSHAELSESSWPGVTMHWLEDGDHSFKPRKRSGLEQCQLIEQAAQYSRAFIDDRLATA